MHTMYVTSFISGYVCCLPKVPRICTGSAALVVYCTIPGSNIYMDHSVNDAPREIQAAWLQLFVSYQTHDRAA